ncbi:MAG: glycosyl hydrolase 108 family protein [Desulfotomaculaceae bacterium]
MADFKTAYRATMDFEGSYNDDPRDLGGETWKGVSRKMNPDWEGWLVVDLIKRSVAKRDLDRMLNADEELEDMLLEFYKAQYWDPLSLDQVKEQEIAGEIFDTAVNQGVIKAAKYFQEGLNLLNNNQLHYSDLVVDGHIGPATLKAYSAYMLTANFSGRSRERNVRTMLKVLNGLQFERYVEICELNPKQEVYFYGWINRI